MTSSFKYHVYAANAQSASLTQTSLLHHIFNCYLAPPCPCLSDFISFNFAHMGFPAVPWPASICTCFSLCLEHVSYFPKWLAFSLPSGLCLNVSSLLRPSLAYFKISSFPHPSFPYLYSLFAYQIECKPQRIGI